ncbi:hypothetical protein EDB19DRAFT_1835792 [Suillus lakei]|nr:hypothetical protein EDB19DRAFT_1835792 [Suillus lakei]
MAALATPYNNFNDGMEALLTGAADPVNSHNYKNCPGQGAYGQGAPVYPCGCYQYSKRQLDFDGAYLQGLELHSQVADAPEAEQHTEGIRQVEDNSGEMLPLKQKRMTSDAGYITPCQFGQNMTNVGCAVSVPVLEVSQKLKRRKLWGRTSKLRLTDRQTEMLSKLYNILESFVIWRMFQCQTSKTQEPKMAPGGEKKLIIQVRLALSVGCLNLRKESEEISVLVSLGLAFLSWAHPYKWSEFIT